MALRACQYGGRQNDAGAQFCPDGGKPLTKGVAARAAVAAGGGGGGGGGGGLVSRTSGPGSEGNASTDAPCPVCGSVVTSPGAGALDRRLIPDRRADHSLTLVLVSDMATVLAHHQRN